MSAPDQPDRSERLRADDMATRREGEFLDLALRNQAAAAARYTGRPGVCANCSAQCAPLARYCDDECRGDHEARQRTLARQGRAG